MTTRDTGRELLWTSSEIGGSGHRDARPMAGPRRGPSAGTQRKGCVVTAAAIPDERALRDPAGACIADERQDLDNAGFAQKVTAVAAVFAAAGLGRGGVLAIMLPNRVELVTTCALSHASRPPRGARGRRRRAARSSLRRAASRLRDPPARL